MLAARTISSNVDFLIVTILFFTSGFTGLVYEVLWMKELGLIFGNTAHATSTTLAAFFIGIGTGSFVFGKILSHVQQPLRIYAYLEIAVAISALLYFLLSDLYNYLYPSIFEILGSGHWGFIIVKFILALVILFPPAFFMGGTLPAMSQYVVQNRSMLGKSISALYAVNIIGAASGAFAAGFLLPKNLGFTQSYILAVTITCAVALVAFFYNRLFSPKSANKSVEIQEITITSSQIAFSKSTILSLAFISGVITLGLEVLWTRMFSQVLHNSVYTFATILIMFLVSLSIGSACARVLITRTKQHVSVIMLLVTCSCLLVAISPYIFIYSTDNLGYFGATQNWVQYTFSVFALVSIVILLPTILLGTIFPYLIKISEPLKQSTGQIIGNLAAVNTIGAVVGSMLAGFVFLEIFGLWVSIKLFALIYIIVAILISLKNKQNNIYGVLSFQIFTICIIFLLNFSALPLVTLDSQNDDEKLLEVFDGSAATVTVVERTDSLRIKVNNFYGLGGTGARNQEERQAHLPLLLHDNPKSVYFLGMGTGITAGAALRHPVDKVVVTELIPEVIEASEKYFTEYLNNLFNDTRASVYAEDGRNYLRASNEKFDVIIADLFVPWKAGTGSLYTQEHYLTAAKRLNHNGIYAQWLPLFQVSENEFGIIAKSMLQVFPQVTLWRGKFHPTKPIALLIGHANQSTFNPSSVETRISQVQTNAFTDTDGKNIAKGPYPSTQDRILQYYVGNLSNSRDLFNRYPINVDDRPIIEYQAPIVHRQKKARQAEWFNKSNLINFYELIYQISPPEKDPFLKNVPQQKIDLIYAGLLYHKSKVYKLNRNSGKEKITLREYEKILKNAMTNL